MANGKLRLTDGLVNATWKSRLGPSRAGPARRRGRSARARSRLHGSMTITTPFVGGCSLASSRGGGRGISKRARPRSKAILATRGDVLDDPGGKDWLHGRVLARPVSAAKCAANLRRAAAGALGVRGSQRRRDPTGALERRRHG